jgi:DHA1 family tetracycline resistance protein-like MFS transporter
MSRFVLLFTIFLDSVGFGLVYPILSPLLMEEQGLLPGYSIATRGLILGLLISTYCIAQFFGGPLLGALSDRKGRKKILIITLWAALASYLLSGASILWGSVLLLFVGRFLSGIAAGNQSIVQSVMVDTSRPEDKAKNFGLIGMAWGTGFIIGPFLGGKLVDPSFGFTLATPFWAAMILSLANLLLAQWLVKETLTTANKTPFSLLTPITNIKRAFQMPTLRTLFAVMFIFSFGWGFFTEFSPLLLMGRFHFDIGEVANFYAFVGVCVALSQGLGIRPFVSRFPAERLLPLALLGMGLTMPFMLTSTNGSILLVTLPIVAYFESFVQPTAATIVSNLTPKESQGELLGIHNSLQWAAIGLAPLLSGGFVAMNPSLPVVVSSFFMLLAAAVFAIAQVRKQKSETKKESV